MAEFWLISVPLDKVSSQSLEKLKRVTVKAGLGSYFRFQIPELKVGTLDALLSVSDDLSRLDSYTETIMRKTTQCIAELMEQSSDKLMENALANGVDLTAYMTRFQWDRAKYPTALPLKTLSDLILKQVAQVETELKSRNTAYSDVKMSLRTLEQKMEKLLEEEDAGIFTVTLFKNAVNKFKANARIHKFVVRDFNLEESEWQRQEMSRLISDEKDQYGIFVRWLKVNIKEVFVAWIHIKALRVFVESVLRYGLPVSFQALLLQPERKQIKRLREELSSVFTHLDPMAAAGKQDSPPEDFKNSFKSST
ncbi:V-type proton ATPase subunit C 1-A [Clarias gariepinus]